MKKLIFLDIDGTLAMPGDAPSEATLAAIRAARAAGHKVFLSTGRCEQDVPEPIRTIDFDGGIYSAGGLVRAEETVISHYAMPLSMVQTIVSCLQEEPVFFSIESPAGNFTAKIGSHARFDANLTHASSELLRFIEKTFLKMESKTIDQYQGETVYKIVYISPSEEIITRIKAKLSGVAKVVSFDNLTEDLPFICGEISDFSINKGNALNEICTYYHVSPSDCIAFGDSMNDAEILIAAGTGIAMGNSPESVKRLADRVCGRCKEDGVAKEFQALGLIP